MIRRTPCSRNPAISANGQFVVYEANASSEFDVFLTNIQTGETKLVSHASGSATQSTGSSRGEPDISADGRFVLYGSDATTIDGNAGGLFVYDAVTGTNKLVSVDANGDPGPAFGFFFGASMSGDGRYVTYLTYNDMTGNGGDTGSDMDIYRYDQISGAVIKLTDTDDDGPSGDPGINFCLRDGTIRRWPFPHLWRSGQRRATIKDLVTGVVTTIDTDGSAGNTRISPNGQLVLFDTQASHDALDTDGTSDVYLYNLKDNLYTLVSADVDGARYGSMSADGRYISFQTSDDLVAGDTNFGQDVYIKDLSDGSLSRVKIDDGSSSASLSGDGSIVAYATAQGSAIDTNGAVDIYATTLGESSSTIFGNYLANTLGGTANGDTIVGYDGDDIIEGKGGNDQLIGGAGVDIYVYNDVAHSPDSPTGALDTILFEADFDKIDLSGIDAIKDGGSPNDDFVFGGNGQDFSGALFVQNEGTKVDQWCDLHP